MDTKSKSVKMAAKYEPGEEDVDLLEWVPPEDVGCPEAFKRAFWKTNGYRTAVSNKARATKAAISAYRKNPNVWHLKNATQKFEALEYAYEKVCNGLLVAAYIADDDAARSKNVNDRQELVKQEFEPIQKDFLAIADDPNADRRAPAPAAPTATVRAFNETLLPDKLTMDFLPHQYRKWKKDVAGFFKYNGLDKESGEVQNIQLGRCISAEVASLIEGEQEDQAPIFDDHVGAMLLIEKYYSMKHTDTAKKLELFTCKPKPGEGPAEFAARQSALYHEADLKNMTADQIRGFFLIANISNSSLRNKLLEMKDPSYDDLIAKINAWSATNAASKAIGESLSSSEATVATVKAGGKKGGKKQQTNGPKPPSNIQNTPASLKGRCQCCGSTQHVKKNCERAERAKCDNCKKPGHYKNVCLAEYIAWKREQNEKSGGKPAKVKTVKEGMSAPPSEDEAGSETDD